MTRLFVQEPRSTVDGINFSFYAVVCQEIERISFLLEAGIFYVNLFFSFVQKFFSSLDD